MLYVDVKVGFKKGVSDPEGANTAKALRLLGFDKVKEVKFSKLYSIALDVESEEEAKQKAEKMCEKLLANPVINTYNITIRAEKEEGA